jgi:hypothetical protein
MQQPRKHKQQLDLHDKEPPIVTLPQNSRQRLPPKVPRKCQTYPQSKYIQEMLTPKYKGHGHRKLGDRLLVDKLGLGLEWGLILAICK